MRKSILTLLVIFFSPWGHSSLRAQPADFDPLDLTGIWIAEQPAESGRTISANRPPMTQWGLERFDAVRSSRDDAPWSNVHSPAALIEQNDAVDWCDPIGYPRVIWEPQSRLMRFVQTPTVLLQMFEWHRNWRDLWTDGRQPEVDPEPRYYGYAVARWEGDTLFVESNGFNDLTWLDPYGSPHSAEMRLEESFRRVSRDSMEWTLRVVDPKAYTAPWEMGDSQLGSKRLLRRVDKSERSSTEELREDMCIWSDQNYYYTNVDTTGVGNQAARPPSQREDGAGGDVAD